MNNHREDNSQLTGTPVGPTSDPARSKRKPLNLVQWCVLVGLVFLSYFAFSRVGIQVVEVVGESMAPTLQPAEHYLLKKWVYLFRSPQRNEVVVISDPGDHGFSVKRIVAAEGDLVEFKHGHVFVNGQQLSEPYLASGVNTFGNTRTGDQIFRCGEDEYFVLGDNRPVSIDSREYGPVPRQNILGLILP